MGAVGVVIAVAAPDGKETAGVPTPSTSASTQTLTGALIGTWRPVDIVGFHDSGFTRTVPPDVTFATGGQWRGQTAATGSAEPTAPATTDRSPLLRITPGWAATRTTPKSELACAKSGRAWIGGPVHDRPRFADVLRGWWASARNHSPTSRMRRATSRPRSAKSPRDLCADTSAGEVMPAWCRRVFGEISGRDPRHTRVVLAELQLDRYHSAWVLWL